MEGLDWSSLGVAAVLAWYLWYTTSVSFPKMLESYRSEAASERVSHDAAITKVTDKIERLCTALESLTDELRTNIGVLPAKPEPPKKP